MAVQAVVLKGMPSGLRLILDDAMEPEMLWRMLDRTLTEAKDFLGRVDLTVEIGERPLTAEFTNELLARMAQFEGIRVRAIVSRAEAAEKRRPRSTSSGNVKLVRGTLRSGQKVSEPGDVVIFGDVNPGAAVIAGGDIFVLGALRGSAHAGRPDDANHVIFAQSMAPTQLRIGPHIAVSPHADQAPGHPELALVEEGQILVTSWRPTPPV